VVGAAADSIAGSAVGGTGVGVAAGSGVKDGVAVAGAGMLVVVGAGVNVAVAGIGVTVALLGTRVMTGNVIEPGADGKPAESGPTLPSTPPSTE
jgi:hypothetical protein